MLEDNKSSPNTENDNSIIEQKMKALVEQLAKNSEFVENNLVVIQKTHTKIDDMPDERHRLFLKLLNSLTRYKKDHAFGSLMKGLLIQNRLFFTFTKASLPKMVENDPDNANKGQSFDMKPFCALLAKNGICQLWDAVVSVKEDEQKVAGYVILNPAIRDLLKVDKQLALEQFKELKKLAGNDWVTEDMVFDSCGELRVSSHDHRVLIEGRRTKSSEPRDKNDDDGVVTEELTTKNVDLSDFFTDEVTQTLSAWTKESNYSIEDFKLKFLKEMAPRFKDFFKNKPQVTEAELSEKLNPFFTASFFGTAVKRLFVEIIKESNLSKAG